MRYLRIRIADLNHHHLRSIPFTKRGAIGGVNTFSFRIAVHIDDQLARKRLRCLSAPQPLTIHGSNDAAVLVDFLQ